MENPSGQKLCDALLRQNSTLDLIKYLHIGNTTMFIIHRLIQVIKFDFPSTFLAIPTLLIPSIYLEVVLFYESHRLDGE